MDPQTYEQGNITVTSLLLSKEKSKEERENKE
jgi:hypothetical protein